MLEALSESHDRGQARPAKATRKPAKKSPAGRPITLQLEKLESREVPAVLVGTGDPASEFMQAAQMSAFFQQSALYTVAQPTSEPTVTWAPRNNLHGTETVQASTQKIAPLPPTLAARIDAKPPAYSALLPLAPNAGSSGRASTGMVLRSDFDQLWPPRVFAPYVELGVGGDFDLLEAASTQGTRFFNLAGVTADAQNGPSWNGRTECAIDGGSFDAALRRQIRDLRARGGDVAVSFGGGQGKELAEAIDNVADLTAAYRTVIDAYALERIDFNLAGHSLADTASIERRSRAISQLQNEFAARGRTLDVWFTLPAAPTGLSDEAVNVIRSAIRHGVEVGGVNIKPMNYPDQAAVDAEGKMGLYTIQATMNTADQLRPMLAVGRNHGDVWRKIGISPNVGNGDGRGESFSTSDAKQVADFARQKGVGMIGMWSFNAQQSASTDGAAAAAPSAKHQPLDFAEIFRAFMAPASK